MSQGFKNVESDQYFYHSDHLGSSSFISDASGSAIQHLQYLPLRQAQGNAFGETFVDQRTGSYDSRYKFSAKEKDDETGYSYFGARYYWPEVSVWLSVDPLSDKYPSMSAYIYCAGNPVVLVDPDGRDWYEFENENGIKTAIWQKGNSKSIELDGQKYRNIGSSYSHQIDNGDYINYYQNFTISIGDKENGMSAVLRNPKAFNYLISSTSPITNDDKSMLFIASMHKAQNRLLRGSAELMANTLNGVGAAAQTTGTGLLAIPGGQAVGAGLIGLGNAASGLGTAISMGINAADGEWGQVAFDLGSLTLSRGLGYGINGLNTTPLQSQFLDGIASSNISIFSGVLNWGMNKKKK